MLLYDGGVAISDNSSFFIVSKGARSVHDVVSKCMSIAFYANSVYRY